jgi:hypothetical protein
VLGRTRTITRSTEEVGMLSPHRPRPWRLRPEELLIESARERLLAQDVIADARARDAQADTPCRRVGGLVAVVVGLALGMSATRPWASPRCPQNGGTRWGHLGPYLARGTTLRTSTQPLAIASLQRRHRDAMRRSAT